MFSDSRQLVARTDSFSSARLMFSFDSDGRVDRHQAAGRASSACTARAQLGVLHERVEVLAEDLGRLDQRHLRADRAVGPDFQRQLVVVGLLADAGFLDLVADADHRAVDGVDRDDADLLARSALCSVEGT